MPARGYRPPGRGTTTAPCTPCTRGSAREILRRQGTLFFPWDKGLKVEQIEQYYDGYKFPNGTPFTDWTHARTGAPLLKAQHPEFELWSQGIHARSGVSCADCHMPYRREGAIKISDHHVRSPLLDVARSCQTCHRFPEAELHARRRAADCARGGR